MDDYLKWKRCIHRTVAEHARLIQWRISQEDLEDITSIAMARLAMRVMGGVVPHRKYVQTIARNALRNAIRDARRVKRKPVPGPIRATVSQIDTSLIEAREQVELIIACAPEGDAETWRTFMCLIYDGHDTYYAGLLLGLDDSQTDQMADDISRAASAINDQSE